MVRVKVCGLMDPGLALAAALLGADMLGLVFAPSRRRVTAEQAQEIVKVVGGADLTPRPPLRHGERERPRLVGVFVNQPLDEVNGLAERCRLDFIQLSGDETPGYCRELGRPFIKALRMAPGEGADGTARQMDSYLDVSPQALFLLDTHLPGLYGGSGRAWDWERASQLAARYPILIAGGLNPENVAAAVQRVSPWGVDVSSGVETDGVKDEAKIRAFIAAVRGLVAPKSVASSL